MKTKILATTILSILSTSSVLADGISGGPRANFANDELIVPCVKVLNSDNESLNGKYFDVVFKQRGKSLNYEAVFAEGESKGTCLAAIDAMLENDDDTEDADGEDEDIAEEDSQDDDSEDDDSKGDDPEGEASESDDSESDDSEDDDLDSDKS